MATILKCKRGHALNKKSSRLIKAKGYWRLKCRVCENEALRLKYNTDPEFKKLVQARNRAYAKAKANAVQNV